MDIDFELETQHLFLIERTCVVCGKQKNLIADFYKCRPDATKISSYAYAVSYTHLTLPTIVSV